MQWNTSSVLITGASRGLGRALALELGRRGATVVGVARRGDALDAVIEEIRGAGGVAWGIAADVGDAEQALIIAARAQAVAGTIDVLINNASTLGALPMPSLLDTDAADLHHSFEVNVFGPFRLARALVGPMVLRGRGAVLNISSDAAVEAYAGWGAYGAGKAALDHISRIWAAEVEGTGVRFVAVDPGEMDTDMHADAMPDADRSALARPADVALRVLTLLESADNGARVAA